MIGLDTNVVLRLILNDDDAQKQRAAKAIEQAQKSGTKVIVALSVVLETEWVLRSSAKMTKTEVLGVFRLLLESYDVEVENEKVLEQALHVYQNASADFAECLFFAQYQDLGCTMLTFDTKAARIDGVELVAALL